MRQHAPARLTGRRPAGRSSSPAVCHFEPMEQRRLLSVSLAGGVLTYVGTPAADSVYITYQVAGDKINVYQGGTVVGSYARTSVKSIKATLGDGNDAVSINPGMGKIPATIDGGNGADNLGGGAGNDTITGGAGDDIVSGVDGNDKLDGGEGSNQVNGGNGNDTLIAGSGADRLTGGAGNDLLDGGRGADRLTGDAGTDTVTYASRTAPVTADISNAVGELPDDGEAGEKDDISVTVENLIGGSGNDRLTGTTIRAGDTTAGLSRNNRLVGGGGSDVLTGLDGNDVLDGGTGRDQLLGGPGVDTADYSARSENLVLNLDGVANDGAAGEGDLISADTENLTGGKGSDTITGNAFSNVLIGNGGNDTIRGGDGNDKLYGNGGLDKLYGEGGNDLLYVRSTPTADADLADGGAGTDSVQKDSLDQTPGVETVLA
jgi:Ca2+-binding RTX toxin-like protein